MDKVQIQEIVKEYLKENLDVCVWTEKHYGDYSGEGEGVKVTVTLTLDGEELTTNYDYTSL